MAADPLRPGALAVLRTGLTPVDIAALPLGEFITRVRAHEAGRRAWRFKLAQVHGYAKQAVAYPDGLGHSSTSATVSPCFRAAAGTDVSPFRMLRMRAARRFAVQGWGTSGWSSAVAHLPP